MGWVFTVLIFIGFCYLVIMLRLKIVVRWSLKILSISRGGLIRVLGVVSWVGGGVWNRNFEREMEKLVFGVLYY